ncbi:hypothetical protein WA577_007098 [Blastocystis sp. JDR]
MQIIVPNLPFAVKKWFPAINDTQVGYYYGYIVSAYSLGGVFGALFWGWFADSFGRKTSISSCLFCQMILAVVFGLAPNFYIALVIRTLWGFTNGNLGVLKTYVSEVCSEDMQSLGFSIIVTMGGIANVVGPSLGGFLGDPETYFPGLVKSYPWIRNYPLFLPGFLSSVLSVLILITVLVFLRESLTKQMRTENAAERKKSQARYHELKALMHVNPDYVPSIDDRYILELNQGSYLQLICKRDVLITCVMYGLYAVIQGGQDAIYPVWLINSPEHHGFDFTSSDLGWMYTGLSPMQIFSTPLLFPLLTRLMDRKSVSFFTGYIYCFFLFLSPIAALANRSSVTVQWLVILFSYGLAQCFRFMFVTNGMVFITNSTYQDFRAKVNGLGQVMSAFGRFLGPSMASNIFAWSLANGLSFPFDYGCGFYVLGLLMALTTSITFLLPDSINFRKPTLKEFANKEHERMEMSSIELAQMKTMESETDRKTPLADNSKVPCPSDNMVVPPAQNVAFPMTPSASVPVTQSASVPVTQSATAPQPQNESVSVPMNENATAPQPQNESASVPMNENATAPQPQNESVSVPMNENATAPQPQNESVSVPMNENATAPQPQNENGTAPQA